jgi:NADP-dependent aldehyde dehydrogenase
LGVGQFCTNPGIIVGIKGQGFSRFANALANEIAQVPAGNMLHAGIQKAYLDKREAALAQQGIAVVASGMAGAAEGQAVATIATVSASVFLNNPLLHHEVFGPYSLLVACADSTELLAVAAAMEGQLTCTIMGTEQELETENYLVSKVAEKCGRIIFNGVPTGVEVCDSMQHGGPFPATTDSRFTSVGADAIRRFVRPLAFQNWPNHLLPPALQNNNPLLISRTINGQLTKDAIA